MPTQMLAGMRKNPENSKRNLRSRSGFGYFPGPVCRNLMG